MKNLNWIEIYKQNILHGNSFPWSEVITNISKFKIKNKLQFLEVGCGRVQMVCIYLKIIIILV